jgi:acetyltransferase-like isoleucine patch superfamily enzyme
MELLQKTRQFVHANGWMLFLMEIGRIATVRCRNFLYGRILSRSDIYLGARPYIRGTRFISIGSHFRAANDLWLEAISSYEGRRYNPRIIIGDNVTISNSVHIAATTSVTVGAGALIGSGVIITDHNHGNYSGSEPDSPESLPALRGLTSGKEVVIGENVWIGDGVSILPGTRIAAGSIVAANSVVSRDVPPGTIVAGAPALPIRKFDYNTREWIQCTPED